MSEDTEQRIETSPVMMPATVAPGSTMGGELREFVPETAGDADWVLRDEGVTGSAAAGKVLDGKGPDSGENTAGGNGQLQLEKGHDSRENVGVDGVLAPVHKEKTRDERGRLLPGIVHNPYGSGGRPAKDKALLIALNEHYPPETVVNMVQEAWDSAATRDSWRGMLEVARFLTEYIVGKPVARSITVSSKAGDMLARLEAIQLGGNEGEEQ